MRTGIGIRASLKQKHSLAFRLKAVQLLSLSEPDAAAIAFKLELDPLFGKLRPFIRRESPRGSRFFLPLGNEAGGIGAAIDWSAHAREISLIKRLGREKFEKYFLYGDIAYTESELSKVTGFSINDIRQIRGFIFSVSMLDHGTIGVIHRTAQSHHYSCIAKMEIHRGKPVLSWLFPQLARGRYVVDFPALTAYVKTLSRKESSRALKLVGIIKTLNARQSAIKNLVELAVKAQQKYFLTGDEFELIPFTASEAARKLGVYPSTVCRAASGRSILTPQGSELPLAYFLPNQRLVAINAISGILESGRKLTDTELMHELRKQCGIILSRRAVNECRRIASSRVAKKPPEKR